MNPLLKVNPPRTRLNPPKGKVNPLREILSKQCNKSKQKPSLEGWVFCLADGEIRIMHADAVGHLREPVQKLVNTSIRISRPPQGEF